VPVAWVQGGTADDGRQHDKDQHGERGHVDAWA